MQRAIRHSALALTLASIAVPALAQEREPWRYRVTIGAQLKPSYPGADEDSIVPLGNVMRARGDDPFAFIAPDESFSIALAKSKAFSIGPAIAFVGKRKPSNVGAAVPEVGWTVEVGGMAQVWLGDHVRLHGEVRRGLGGHEGWVGNAQADAVFRDGDKWLFSIGPRVTWADSTFHDAYFSVTPATAAATGLPVYDAGSGIEAAGVASELRTQMGAHWGLFGYAKYDRLLGDAAKSPIVLTYGSRDQYSGGVGLSYVF